MCQRNQPFGNVGNQNHALLNDEGRNSVGKVLDDMADVNRFIPER